MSKVIYLATASMPQTAGLLRLLQRVVKDCTNTENGHLDLHQIGDAMRLYADVVWVEADRRDEERLLASEPPAGLLSGLSAFLDKGGAV